MEQEKEQSANKPLKELFGWNQEGADFLKATKKATPNHRKNRSKNKAARAARKKNRIQHAKK